MAFYTLLAVGMAIVLLLDLASRWIRSSSLSEPIIALVLGVVISPDPGIGFIDLAQVGEPKKILEYVAQITLAIGLMGVALRIPPFYTIKFRRTLAVVLLLGMPLMWLSASAVAYLVFSIPVSVALLIGAVITPTDPVVSTSIVTGHTAEACLTRRLRHALSAESGFNDGLAFPFVALGILLLSNKSNPEVMNEWLRVAWLLKTLMAVALGGMLGYAAAKLLHLAERFEGLEIDSFLSYALALSLLAFAGAELVGANGILAVFIAGIAFSFKARAGERVQEENIQEAVNRFFTLPIFLLIGLALPWAEWVELGWSGILFAIGVLLFRRFPVWMLLSGFSPGLRRREMAFAGWFGPVGIAALYYALHAEKETGNALVWPLATLVICTSVVAHGFTAAPFSRVLKRVARR